MPQPATGGPWILAIGGSGDVGRRWVERLGRLEGREPIAVLCWAPNTTATADPVVVDVEPLTALDASLQVWEDSSPGMLHRRRRPLQWMASHLDKTGQGIERISLPRRVVSAGLRRSSHTMRRVSQLSDGRVLWHTLRPMIEELDAESLPRCVYLFDDDALCTGYHLARRWPTLRFADEESATTSE
jgi:hypothetical protein